MKKFKIILMTFLTTLLLGAILSFSGCEKIDVPAETPNCIKDKIKKEKDKCLDKVYEYEYVGKKVYLFIYPCPEGCITLVDENCNDMKDANGNLICICTFGGSSCDSNFVNTRTNEKLIWQK